MPEKSAECSELIPDGCFRCKGCLGSSVDLRRQDERLHTFRALANNLKGAESLAAQGFYFTGTGGQVQCQFCGLQVELDAGQELSVDVAREVEQVHREFGWNCDLVQHRQCGNIPLKELPSEAFSTGIIEPGPPHDMFRSDKAQVPVFR